MGEASNEQAFPVQLARFKPNTGSTAYGPAGCLVVHAYVHFVSLTSNKAVLDCLFFSVIVDKAVVRVDIVVVSSAKLTLREAEH